MLAQLELGRTPRAGSPKFTVSGERNKDLNGWGPSGEETQAG